MTPEVTNVERLMRLETQLTDNGKRLDCQALKLDRIEVKLDENLVKMIDKIEAKADKIDLMETNGKYDRLTLAMFVQAIGLISALIMAIISLLK